MCNIIITRAVKSVCQAGYMFGHFRPIQDHYIPFERKGTAYEKWTSFSLTWLGLRNKGDYVHATDKLTNSK